MKSNTIIIAVILVVLVGGLILLYKKGNKHSLVSSSPYKQYYAQLNIREGKAEVRIFKEDKTTQATYLGDGNGNLCLKCAINNTDNCHSNGLVPIINHGGPTVIGTCDGTEITFYFDQGYPTADWLGRVLVEIGMGPHFRYTYYVAFDF